MCLKNFLIFDVTGTIYAAGVIVKEIIVDICLKRKVG